MDQGDQARACRKTVDQLAMDLYGFPKEIFTLIIEDLVLEVGFVKAVRLRLVDSMSLPFLIPIGICLKGECNFMASAAGRDSKKAIN